MFRLMAVRLAQQKMTHILGWSTCPGERWAPLRLSSMLRAGSQRELDLAGRLLVKPAGQLPALHDVYCRTV